MADHLPLYAPGEAITYRTSAAVIGGRLLEVSGADTVAAAGAVSLKVVGVAGFDAGSGEDVTVYWGGIQRIPATAGIAAGAEVATAAAGKVAAAVAGAGRIGVALNTTTVADQLVVVKFD